MASITRLTDGNTPGDPGDPRTFPVYWDEFAEAFEDHTAGLADKHDAADVTFTPAGNLSADDVQAALEELDSEKAASSHTHDDRYYTESEVDSLLSGKSSTSHNHDHGNLTGLSDDDHPQYPLIVNTDSDAGRTIYVGATDPTGSYSPVAGDVWLEPPA